MRNTVILILAMLAVLVASVMHDSTQKPEEITAQQESSEMTPLPAPDITMVDDTGRTFTLKELQGNVVLLHFWASWCVPCIKEFPPLINMAASLKERVSIVAISSDKDAASMRRFLKRHGFSSPRMIVVWDKDQRITQDQFAITRFPETIIVSPNGKMVRKVVGETNWIHADMMNYLGALTLQSQQP